ncbi:MAG: alpha/beta fold hydrolase [Aquamicrobium sp.]|uniref:alpha/beta fold hydrolase n=1 Tax=Aquamicrobium sp. TaxID=1872579 RepID=UPI00349EBA74|nr:alpha/beta fold hydrolase [Aquamicrobium sp.]MCO5158243.1 alpha/beta fold hydrolase [Aquamicrobium sp.]
MEETPKLIDLVYASTIDPHRYDDFMACWQVHLEEVIAGSPEEDATDPDAAQAEIERHFNRAFAILERLGRQGAEGRSFGALVDGESRPAVLVEPSGRIIAVNGRARTLFGVSSGDKIDVLSLEAAGLSNIRKALSRIAEEPPGRLLTVTRVLSPKDGTTPIIALTRAPMIGDRPVALLSVADIEWSERIGELLRQVFGLTPAECEIARGIIAGFPLDRLARERGRSEQTVKTQAKSVLRKLELRNQAELVRMIAGLMQMDAAPELLSPAGRIGGDGRTTIMLGGTRLLDVSVIGPLGGRPVLFLHGMLDGHGITRAARSLLDERNIRLICPVRPNFDRSSPDGDAPGAPERFASDIEATLDHLGISSCPVIGHMAGSVYAFAAAARLGRRITHIVNIAGGVPIVSTSQFAIMTPRQRVVAHTARFAPKLLPLVLRAGIALLDSGGDRAFMKALYASAPVDFNVASHPEVFAILRNGYRFTVAQGHRAFEIDAHQVVQDWTAVVESSDQKVMLLHGCHDPVVGMQTVRNFAARLGDRAELVEHPTQGQLLFYADPGFVLDALERVL